MKNIYDDFTKDQVNYHNMIIVIISEETTKSEIFIIILLLFLQLEYMWDKYCDMESTQKPYFLVSLENESLNVYELKDKLKYIDEENHKTFYFVFYDLSLLENCPGSTLRNYITLILQYW